jgi:GNAT superfamily N-acetyltransferase
MLGCVATTRRRGAAPVHVDIRIARPEDAERLRETTTASKGYWGYDPERVRDWALSYDFSATRLVRQELYVAEVDKRIVAWAGLIPPVDGVAVLDDLWVEPDWIGKGIGSSLFALARDRAARLGARVLEWGAEPNAVGFYTKMGGRYLRDEISEWGRQTTVMSVDLDNAPPSG